MDQEREKFNEDLVILREKVTKLKSLLDDPELGSFGWSLVYGNLMRSILIFWINGEWNGKWEEILSFTEASCRATKEDLERMLCQVTEGEEKEVNQ